MGENPGIWTLNLWYLLYTECKEFLDGGVTLVLKADLDVCVVKSFFEQ